MQDEAPHGEHFLSVTGQPRSGEMFIERVWKDARELHRSDTFCFAHKWAKEKIKAAAWGYKHVVPTALRQTEVCRTISGNLKQSRRMTGYVIDCEPAFTFPELFTRPVIGYILIGLRP